MPLLPHPATRHQLQCMERLNRGPSILHQRTPMPPHYFVHTVIPCSVSGVIGQSLGYSPSQVKSQSLRQYDQVDITCPTNCIHRLLPLQTTHKAHAVSQPQPCIASSIELPSVQMNRDAPTASPLQPDIDFADPTPPLQTKHDVPKASPTHPGATVEVGSPSPKTIRKSPRASPPQLDPALDASMERVRSTPTHAMI
jgi:hypothetical protein